MCVCVCVRVCVCECVRARAIVGEKRQPEQASGCSRDEGDEDDDA